jgi:hypothetical protein
MEGSLWRPGYISVEAPFFSLFYPCVNPKHKRECERFFSSFFPIPYAGIVDIMNAVEDSSTPFLNDTTDEHDEKPKILIEKRTVAKQKRMLHVQWFTFCVVVAFITCITTYSFANHDRNHNLDRICSRYTSQSLSK